jgi:hypothetical protein
VRTNFNIVVYMYSKIGTNCISIVVPVCTSIAVLPYKFMDVVDLQVRTTIVHESTIYNSIVVKGSS